MIVIIERCDNCDLELALISKYLHAKKGECPKVLIWSLKITEFSQLEIVKNLLCTANYQKVIYFGCNFSKFEN